MAQSDGAEYGVAASAIEILRCEIESAEILEALGANGREFIEQVVEWCGLRCADVGEAIEGGEVARLAVDKNALHPRNPIGAVGIDEVRDNVFGAHGIGAFVLLCPHCGQVAQEAVESEGCAGEESDLGSEADFFVRVDGHGSHLSIESTLARMVGLDAVPVMVSGMPRLALDFAGACF